MRLSTTSSPHVKGKDTTVRLMRDVVIALLPALVLGIYFQGLRAAVVVTVTIVTCVASEFVFDMLVHRRNTIRDCSAVVTGLLLGMTLPATVPYYVAAIGGVFAMVVVKGFFGGLGQNIFTPALAARAFMLLCWPAAMVRYPAFGQQLPLTGDMADVVTSATALHHMVMPGLPEESFSQMLLGNMAGSIGEVSAIAILVGGVYLIVRGVISCRIPVAYLGTVAVLTLAFSKGQPALPWMLSNLLCGGVMLAAFFMATDYATSPVTPVGQIVYGIGCGALTVLFRYFGIFPEGVTYAILLMNGCVWFIDQVTMPRRFGTKKGGAQ